jgi:hypothetical protein
MKRLLVLTALFVFAWTGAVFAEPVGCPPEPDPCACAEPITVFNTVEVWIPCLFEFGWLYEGQYNFAVQGPHVIYAPTIEWILMYCEDPCAQGWDDPRNLQPCNFSDFIGCLEWRTNYDELSGYVCRDNWYPDDYCDPYGYDAYIMQLASIDWWGYYYYIPVCEGSFYDGYMWYTEDDFDPVCGWDFFCIWMWLTCVDMTVDPGTYYTTVYWTMAIDCC